MPWNYIDYFLKRAIAIEAVSINRGCDLLTVAESAGGVLSIVETHGCASLQRESAASPGI